MCFVVADLIALPECFIAMEDWGLIHFEEDGLLYKKNFSSEQVQTSLLMRWLPHEIVHQVTLPLVGSSMLRPASIV